jgi:hypothetical protein
VKSKSATSTATIGFEAKKVCENVKVSVFNIKLYCNECD